MMGWKSMGVLAFPNFLKAWDWFWFALAEVAEIRPKVVQLRWI